MRGQEKEKEKKWRIITHWYRGKVSTVPEDVDWSRTVREVVSITNPVPCNSDVLCIVWFSEILCGMR